LWAFAAASRTKTEDWVDENLRAGTGADGGIIPTGNDTKQRSEGGNNLCNIISNGIPSRLDVRDLGVL
jgi:hypothetical protein